MATNDTLVAYAEETHDETNVVAWIVVPVILGSLVYMTLALFIWPYARPIVSPWILILCIIFPPLFPFLLFFVFFALCTAPVIAVPSTVTVQASPQEVYIVETRGRVRAPARGTVPPRRMGGTSV